MLIMESITFFIAISGLILSIINAIIQIRNHRRSKIIEKLPLKKRLFKEWFDLTKDMTNRMVFTEIKEKEDFTVYEYRIKEEDGTGFIEPAKQKILFSRYLDLNEDVYINCGFQKKDKKEKDLADELKQKMIKKNISAEYITIPNDILPNNSEDIKSGILNSIIRLAKENGVRLKYKK